MSTDSLKLRISDDMKSAMRAKEKQRLATVRLILAAIKQKEVDERKDLKDDDVVVILDKMCKQRKDSITQYDAANRDDLAEIERQELDIIQSYLPQPLSDDEINTLIDEAVESTGASSMADMGKVMGYVKPKAQGRADMGSLSGLVKGRLS